MKDNDISELSRRSLLKSGALAVGGILLRGPRGLGARLSSVGDTKTADLMLRCDWLENPLGLQTARPRLSWTPLAVPTSHHQMAYQVTASSSPGLTADLWDTGRIDSAECAVEYTGIPLQPHQSAYWRVRQWFSTEPATDWSPLARWSRGPVAEADWGGSRWIGRDDLLESTQEQMPGTPEVPKEPNFFPAPYLRSKFVAKADPISALLYACAPGFAELYVNGQRLGNTERDPGFTNFDQRLLYVTHDVTRIIKRGNNVVGAILGTGWYDVHDVATWHINTAPWRQRPRMRSTLVLSYADGTVQYVPSSALWRTSTGPILRDGIYTGEVYDARYELPGWSDPGYDDSEWKPALAVEAPRGKLTPLTCEPIRITETIKPIAVTEPKPGIFIVDMGQNFSGHTQLRVTAPAGHAITMRYAEVLNPDGTLNSKPIDHFMMATQPRQPFQQDTYIAKGSGGVEVWEQRFSWSGFQYVEVTNFPGTPTVENFRGRFAHTDLITAGEFHCSDETANRVQQATRQSFWSNAQGYPTDCPQREKNGWTGDACMAVEAGLMNFHSVAFYAKWMDDFADAQRPDGGVPVLVPNGGWGNGERWPGDICPPWDAAYLVIAWQLYRFTGDSRVLARHADHLQKYVEFFLSHRRTDGLVPALGIGDWSPWKTTTPQDFITNAYLYYDLILLAKVFTVLGHSADARRYEDLARQQGSLTHRTFYSPDTHRYSNGSQMAQGTALHFGFVPTSERKAVFADLVGQVETLGHLDVGFLGASYVTRALAEGGRADLAYRVCCQRMEMPSYAYWVTTMRSTTLWEGWKAGPSYNHIMFGDISAWFYQWIAGIQQEDDSVAFERIVFRPTPVGEITEARASYLSPFGKIESSWSLSGNKMKLELEVPDGATARLVLPIGSRVTTSGVFPAANNLVLESGIHRVGLALE